jgi:hypothetical protein
MVVMSAKGVLMETYNSFTPESAESAMTGNQHTW